jgi:hypothetical protein
MEVEPLWLEMRKKNKHIDLEWFETKKCELKNVGMSPW